MKPKFIKKLDTRSFFGDFANFLKNFPIITFFYLVVITTCTVLSLMFQTYLQDLNLRIELKILSEMFTCKNVIDFLILIGMISGILYEEEQRGSCRYLLAFPFRYMIVLGIQIGYNYLKDLSPELPDTRTSTPILFCLFIAAEQSLNLKISVVDILKLPLQIRTGLYPLCLILILELIQIRADIIIVYLAGLGFDLLNIKKFGVFLAKRCHGCCCRCCFKNFVKPPIKMEQYDSPHKKQVDNLATSNSIVIEDEIIER